MTAEALMDIIRSVVLTGVLFGAVRLIALKSNTLCVVFYALAVACILFSDIYWIVYDILRPETRMPFAANEIAEWAMFLLLGESLKSFSSEYVYVRRFDILFTIAFVIANIALWIGWSGEWAQDILTGASLAYFLCVLVVQIRQNKAFTALQWRIMLVACIVLIAGQTCTFLTDGDVKNAFDLSCYVLLFLIATALIGKTIASLIEGKETRQTVCYAFASFAWAVITLYMSGGGFYVAAMAFTAICFPLMLLSLKKEVTAR